jgi:tetratricopeptide (TPR) repeat protein
MFRRIAWILGGLLVVVFALAATVNLLAVSASELPAPDPAMKVATPGGSLSLGEILSMGAGDEGLPVVLPDAPSPTPDPALPIDAGGEVAPAEDVDLAEADEQLAAIQAELQRLLSMDDAERQADHVRRIEERYEEELAAGDLYALARYNEALGNTEQALALYRSVPEGHPSFGRTQRRIGWDFYAQELDDPAKGVSFVHASLAENPMDGNAWQDAARVYVHTLGLDFLD